jgi:phytol kinase
MSVQAELRGQHQVPGLRIGSSEIETEFLRKSIHLLIAAVPMLAIINIAFTISLLGAGTIIYTYAERRRAAGYRVAFISIITTAAARERDEGKFVLGPVTLAIGAMIALLLYPEPAAFIAIYALAFGDGLSSIVGKLFGSTRIPLTGGKTLAGSAACFLAVFFVSYRFTSKTIPSLAVAAAATLLEALPTKDLDNIILPVGTGFVASQLLLT